MKKKQKLVCEKIYEPVYKFDLIFISGCSWEEAKKRLKPWCIHGLPIDLQDSIGACVLLSEDQFPGLIKGSCYVVWVRGLRDYYTLVHEVGHLVIKVFEDKRIEIEDGTSEPFCYYLEHWVRKLYKLMSQA